MQHFKACKQYPNLLNDILAFEHYFEKIYFHMRKINKNATNTTMCKR